MTTLASPAASTPWTPESGTAATSPVFASASRTCETSASPQCGSRRRTARRPIAAATTGTGPTSPTPTMAPSSPSWGRPRSSRVSRTICTRSGCALCSTWWSTTRGSARASSRSTRTGSTIRRAASCLAIPLSIAPLAAKRSLTSPRRPLAYSARLGHPFRSTRPPVPEHPAAVGAQRRDPGSGGPHLSERGDAWMISLSLPCPSLRALSSS